MQLGVLCPTRVTRSGEKFRHKCHHFWLLFRQLAKVLGYFPPNCSFTAKILILALFGAFWLLLGRLSGSAVSNWVECLSMLNVFVIVTILSIFGWAPCRNSHDLWDRFFHTIVAFDNNQVRSGRWGGKRSRTIGRRRNEIHTKHLQHTNLFLL